MEESYNDDGDCISLEVKGFYFGEPDEKENKAFYGDYKVEFDC